MSRNWYKRIRTAIAAALAALTLAAGINWGVVQDALEALHIDTHGLGSVAPQAIGALIVLLSALAAFFTAINQALDKTNVPSLTVPPEPAHIPADAATPSHITSEAATDE